jgi:aspartate-semialdehyde dehydrogenase
MSELRLAILGATGAVGSTLLEVLEERDLPLAELRLLASERSAGQTRRFRGEELEVQAATPASFEGIDVAIFSAGASRSRSYAPHAVASGALVIDNSSAFRMDPEVPLVVPEVNPHAARAHRGLIANPNCSTMQLVPVLKPLHDAAGLEHVTVSTYQAVSGTGQKAIDALLREAGARLAGEPATAEVYPHPIAFNALPFAGAWQGDEGYTDEELKLVNESRKILELPDLAVSATCVRVPVVTCHSEAVWVELRRELAPERVRELLRSAPGVVVVDDPAADAYPTPLAAAGRDEVFVGRIRRDLGRPRSLALWIVSDNLRKGAATNAVQIAELALREGLLGERSAA